MRSVLRRGRPRPPADASLEALSAADRSIVERALPYTLTGVARLQAVIDAVRYCVARDLSGAFAECGVWRGGSVLAMVLTLQELGRSDRDLYLYDTFEGMTAPSERDVSELDPPALRTWNEARARGEEPWPEYFDPEQVSERAVSELLHATGYPAERMHLVRGPVESTLPGTGARPACAAPPRHRLVRLHPARAGAALSAAGARRRPDHRRLRPLAGSARGGRRVLRRHPPAPLLQRVDYTCRMAVKP